MNKNSICAEVIKQKLKTEYIGKDFYFFEKTTSTFDEAEKISKKNGTVILAKAQTNGRGRLGRQWESNKGGIYFSVILKPEFSGDNLHIITPLCAVAIERAISKYTPCKIKWPNDIVSDSGKKLCGILSKLQTDKNGDCYINVGIGINANNENFDKSLKYASSIKLVSGSEINENELLCSCLFELEKCCNFKNTDIIMKEYKEKCLTLKSRVKIISIKHNKTTTGLCMDITPEGALVVKKDDGETICVNSGEVSVRGIYGEDYV